MISKARKVFLHHFIEGSSRSHLLTKLSDLVFIRIWDWGLVIKQVRLWSGESESCLESDDVSLTSSYFLKLF